MTPSPSDADITSGISPSKNRLHKSSSHESAALLLRLEVVPEVDEREGVDAHVQSGVDAALRRHRVHQLHAGEGVAAAVGLPSCLEKSTNIRIFENLNEFWCKQIFTHSNELQFLIRMTYFAKIGIQNVKMNLFLFISQPFSHGFSFTMAHFEAQNMLVSTFEYIRIFE